MSTPSCTKCNQPLHAADAKFCLKCGAKTGGGGPSSSSGQTSVPPTSASPRPTTTTTTSSSSSSHSSTTTSSHPPPHSQPAPSSSASSSDSSSGAGTPCHHCGKPTGEKVVVDHPGNHYHPECFVCTACKKPIDHSYAFDPDGRLCCESCVRALLNLAPGSDACHRCGRLVEGHVYAVGNLKFHPDCFTCVSCAVALKEGEFIVRPKGLQCKPCILKESGEVCAVCNKLLEKGGIKAIGKHWHNECFNCKKCNKNLAATGKFISEDNAPFCIECATARAEAEAAAKRAAEPAPAASTSGLPPAKYCWECGKPTHPQSKFCMNCGISLEV